MAFKGVYQRIIHRRFLITAISFLIIVCAILIIAFKSQSLAIYDGRSGGVDGAPSRSNPLDWVVLPADYPNNIGLSTHKVLFAVAGLSLVMAVCTSTAEIFTFRRRKPVKLVRCEQIIIITLLGIVAICALTAIIYTFVRHSKSAHFYQDTYEVGRLVHDPQNISNVVTAHEIMFAYELDTFDLGTWACETKDQTSFLATYNLPSLKKQCALETACLVLPILLFLLCFLLAGAAWSDMRTTKLVFTEYKLTQLDDDDYDDDY
ncbi:hypothetical protein EJ05DRAFT_302498 [Pseudovirgaria hyperparasitica]|uniref:Uncharacterized protein n=1 Tax=Pseudovirgaria hyperparasitica TaxID=470096 RepID=A0A6A6WA77_9PEZI|nr:uncharacterized protein EJ05DRAFT_302498 [Pseudovirgaria hyperparasitica]KAF2759573.1 hypothetical protein EJ05DRAFT_302498 [Pseudovirgaria hyperparasitica]